MDAPHLLVFSLPASGTGSGPGWRRGGPAGPQTSAPGFGGSAEGREASRTGRSRPPAPSPDPEAWEDRRPPPSLPRPDRPAAPGEEGTPSPCRADRGRRAPGESCSSSVSAPPPHPTSSPGPFPRASPGRSPLHHRTWNHPPCQTSWPEGGGGKEKLETASSHSPPRPRSVTPGSPRLPVSPSEAMRIPEPKSSPLRRFTRRPKGAHSSFFLRDSWCFSN